LISLLATLLKAEHSAAPHAGMAFLETMDVVFPPVIGPLAAPSPEIGVPSMQLLLLTTMLCELCRLLEHSFPNCRKHLWDISSFCRIRLSEHPLYRLDSVLGDPHWLRASPGDAEFVRDQLWLKCGAEFCCFNFCTASPEPGAREVACCIAVITTAF